MKKTALAGGASLLALLMAGLSPAQAQYAQSGYTGTAVGGPGGPFSSSSVPSMALTCVAADLVHVVPCGGDATHPLYVSGGTGGSGTASTVAQGAPNTTANAWPVSEATLDAALQSAAGIKVAIVGTPAVTVAGVATAGNQTPPVAAGVTAPAAEPVQGIPGGVPLTATVRPPLSAPTGGLYPVTTTAAAAIPASTTRLRWSWQAQGTGYACASWVTTAVTITVNASNIVTCGGAGAFALSNASNAASTDTAIANTAMTVIGAPGTGTLALAISYEQQ